MKKLFLIGDSIRYGITDKSVPTKVCGYEFPLREKTAGLCEIYAPAENCRFAEYTLRYLHEWAAKAPAKDIDVVHWNNGLCDVLRILGDEPMTPREMYTVMLERIYGRIRSCFQNAEVIFATSTPVIEAMSRPDFTRRNSDIALYNNDAVTLMDKLGVRVNDLHSVAESFGGRYHADWVHFDREGASKLADAVSNVCNINKGDIS